MITNAQHDKRQGINGLIPIALVLTLVSGFGSLFAQKPSDSPSTAPDREVIVKFIEGVLMPPLGIDRGKPEDFQIHSDSLRYILRQSGAKEIARVIPGFKTEDRVRTSRMGEKVTLSDWENVYLVRLPVSEALIGFITALKNRPEVVYAEPNGLGAPLLIPNDSNFNRQSALKNDGSYLQGNGALGADINATNAWDITTGSSSI